MFHKEIERRFKLTEEQIEFVRKGGNLGLPKLDNMYAIEQFYYHTKKGSLIRYRKVVKLDTKTEEPIESKYFITIKKGEGLIREEQEEEINKTEYYVMKGMFDNKPLRKMRYIAYLEDGNKSEIDLFYNEKISPLIIQEFEFDNEKQALEFKPYSWCGEEITDNNEFTNYSLWKKINNL